MSRTSPESCRTPTVTPARRAARCAWSSRRTATQGLWVGNALDTGFIEDLTRQDVADALDAAAAVGDDRIQERTQGRVVPESWTHGSSEQRQSWFVRGIEGSGPQSCDTFKGQV